jgi:competence protein ComEC
MYRRHLTLTATAVLMLMAVVAAHAKQPSEPSSKDLKIRVVDVEGGAATLFLTPEGKSMLIDTGWPPGFVFPKPKPGEPPPPPETTSSADRIAAAAAAMGITKLDYLVMTHYHGDHLGGLESVLAKLPADTFVDHGPNRQPARPAASGRPPSKMDSNRLYEEWVAAYQGHHHISARPGQSLKIGSLRLTFVASDGKVLSTPLPGAGEPNPLCMHVKPKDATSGEDVASLGMLMTFGKTRILDLGDLTWDKELELVCPVNKIGKVDVYFVPGHGNDLSNIAPDAAFDPLVALLQNGPRKGGDADVVREVGSFPELEGFWRLHASVAYPDLDGDPHYITNVTDRPDAAYPLVLDIAKDGKITVTNPRNGFSKTYQARGTEAGY